MTATNFTENDLTNPVTNVNRRVQAYNDNVSEMLDGVLDNTFDPIEQTTTDLIESLGGKVVGYSDVPDWPHEQFLAEEAANDNEPVQLDLFSS